MAAPRLAKGEAALQESQARLELAVAVGGARGLGMAARRRPDDPVAGGQGDLRFRPRRAGDGRDDRGDQTHRGDLAKTREQTRRALDPASRDDAAYEYRIITPGRRAPADRGQRPGGCSRRWTG